MNLLGINSLNITMIMLIMCCAEFCHDTYGEMAKEISIKNECGEAIYVFEAEKNYDMGISNILMDKDVKSERIPDGNVFVMSIIGKDANDNFPDLWDYYVYNFLILKESTYEKYSLDDIMRLNIADTIYSLKYRDFEKNDFEITYTGTNDLRQ